MRKLFFLFVLASQFAIAQNEIAMLEFKSFMRVRASDEVLSALSSDNVCYNISNREDVVVAKYKNKKMNMIPLGTAGFLFKTEQRRLLVFKKKEIGAVYEKNGIVNLVSVINGSVIITQMGNIFDCLSHELDSLKKLPTEDSVLVKNIITCVDTIKNRFNNGYYGGKLKQETTIGTIAGVIIGPKAKISYNTIKGLKDIYNEAIPCLTDFYKGSMIIKFCWKNRKRKF